MKKSKKILILCLMILSFATITKMPFIINISKATTVVTKTNINSKEIKMDVNKTTKTYTGKKITRKITLYNGNKKLKRDRDYIVTYKNNKNPGKATITIKGIGQYTGIVKKYFYIRPKATKLYSAKVYNYNQAKIHWKRDSKADGYQIYMYSKLTKKYVRIKTIKGNKTTYYIKRNLDPDVKYTFKVRAYKKVKGKTVYGYFGNKVKKNLPSKLLSEVTLTSKNSGANRNHNIKLASKACNNIILKPGESFNWIERVGEAAAWKGYKKATIFVNKQHKQDYGGGVCQVSSTIYQAAKNSKLKIIERHTHSLPVSYTTTGNDATVAYSSRKNLIFKNNKSYSIKIKVTSNDGSCTCKIYRI